MIESLTFSVPCYISTYSQSVSAPTNSILNCYARFYPTKDWSNQEIADGILILVISASTAGLLVQLVYPTTFSPMFYTHILCSLDFLKFFSFVRGRDLGKHGSIEAKKYNYLKKIKQSDQLRQVVWASCSESPRMYRFRELLLSVNRCCALLFNNSAVAFKLLSPTKHT